jgi:hypothetical protein
VNLLAVELNDAGITVAGEAGVLAHEPGYVLAAGGKTVAGNEAYRRARLQPRHTSNRHWATLSLEPGSAGVDAKRSAAELAYAQLQALWQGIGDGAAAVLVVPGAYSSAQLGVLLGIAQECGIDVRAMVDAAVAGSARPYPGRQLLYVDASLHRVSVTALEQGEEAVVRAEHALESGLASLRDVFARRIAEFFVLATRFDPFHHAESEQALYDRLPGWLEQLHDNEKAELTLPHGGEELSVTAERELVLRPATSFYRAIVQLIARSREANKGVVVQISQRLAALPGFAAELARLDDAHIEMLAAGHAPLAALTSRALVESSQGGSGGVKLLKHLPWRASAVDIPAGATSASAASAASPAAAAAAAPAALAPTHVVYRGRAYRVDGGGVVVGREPVDGRRTIVVGDQGGVSREHAVVSYRDGELRLHDMSRYGTFVNEKRVSGETVLKPADVIRIGSPGAELMVIGLEANDGV